VGQVSLEDTLAGFAQHLLGKEVEGAQYLPADVDFFGQIVKGVVAHQLDIDPMVDANLPDDWPVTRIDATLRAILRAAVFELLKRPDIPSKVVISEYLDIARAFYDGEVPGLVNGVLDAIAKRLEKAG
jgi:transcription antitermination protein NusB